MQSASVLALLLVSCPHTDFVDILVVHWIYFLWTDGVNSIIPSFSTDLLTILQAAMCSLNLDA
jgi:hypothetical protein